MRVPLPVFATAAAGTVAPNILVILTDDQGWGDLDYNCDNSTAMCATTPNLRALATSPGSTYFHRFYAAAGVCSPTRASILTGRTHQRDCINFALSCCQEDPAATCAAGNTGALPTNEFTISDAAHASKLGDYQTIQMGKWHLGDFWDKKIPGMNKQYPVANPITSGHFDTWFTTEAEVSSSRPNCGCYPVDNGPMPAAGPPFATCCTGAKPQRLPSGGTAGCNLTYMGDRCIVNGGVEGKWAFPCTDYYYPNASDPRAVSGLADWRDPANKVPGDDSVFIVEQFTQFLDARVSDSKPWLAHLCLHSIHEPHPALPEFYRLYQNDPDYLGTLTQMDSAIGVLRREIDARGMGDNTVVFMTSDNGPHQGAERSDIAFSTGHMLRQCKASVFEGGIRVPGLLYLPPSISPRLRRNTSTNVTTPAGALDVLPTVMDLLEVDFKQASPNPTWVLDGTSLLPMVAPGGDPNAPRATPLVFSFGPRFATSQQAIIDNDWKILTRPAVGQCDQQPGFNFSLAKTDRMFLYNLRDDVHESRDLAKAEPAQFKRMRGLLLGMRASINNSRYNEVKCCTADYCH
jgi:arylsulfatase A-like enzyme